MQKYFQNKTKNLKYNELNPHQMDEKSILRNRIVFMDGLAIFFIVLCHTMGGLNTSDSIFVNRYTGVFGLTLFTFSAGLKLGVNHSNEIENRLFIKKYFTKRLIRMYKPYIGYSILTFIPLVFIDYIPLQIL